MIRDTLVAHPPKGRVSSPKAPTVRPSAHTRALVSTLCALCGRMWYLLRDTVYFDGHGIGQPLTVLLAYVVAAGLRDPEDEGHLGVLALGRAAVEQGEASFPLSLAYYVETQNRCDWRSRFDDALTMGQFPGGLGFLL